MTLTKEEREILKSVESGQWNRVADSASQLAGYQETAQASLKKDKRVNIRMTKRDLVFFKKAAIEEGLPYQTLISSILHKYINGRLVDHKD